MTYPCTSSDQAFHVPALINLPKDKKTSLRPVGLMKPIVGVRLAMSGVRIQPAAYKSSLVTVLHLRILMDRYR